MSDVGSRSVQKPSRLAPVVISTRDAEPAGRFEIWRDRFSSINDVQAAPDAASAFDAHSAQWRLGPFLFGVNETPARRLERSRRHCARDDLDHWAIRVSGRSSGVLQTGARVEAFGPGAVTVTSFAEPYVEDRTAGDWACLIFPRDAFPDITLRLDALASRPFPRTTTSGVLADHILSLAARLPAAAADEAPALADMTRSILAGCLSRIDPSAGLDGADDALRRVAVDRVIRRNLGSARLDVERICALARVSRSALYRLFEGEGGVAAHVRRQRLRLIAEDLRNPDLAGEPIAALAERRGFHCAASFSRSYRDAFGQSPREARNAALSGIGPARQDWRQRLSPERRPDPGASLPSLRDILP
jgi:AraC-like DNA-binding protein